MAAANWGSAPGWRLMKSLGGKGGFPLLRRGGCGGLLQHNHLFPPAGVRVLRQQPGHLLIAQAAGKVEVGDAGQLFPGEVGLPEIRLGRGSPGFGPDIVKALENRAAFQVFQL